MATRHICSNISGLMKNHTDEQLGDIFDMDGKKVRAELQALVDKGHKLLPSEGCTHFDPFEKGCECWKYEDHNLNEIKNMKKGLLDRLYNATSAVPTMFFSFTLAYFAMKYSPWIFLLFIPYFYQTVFAILFKNRIRQWKN